MINFLLNNRLQLHKFHKIPKHQIHNTTFLHPINNPDIFSYFYFEIHVLLHFKYGCQFEQIDGILFVYLDVIEEL